MRKRPCILVPPIAADHAFPRPVRARRADRGILSRSLEATFSASGVRRRTPCPLCSEVVCARCSSIGDVRSSSLSPSRWRCQALPRRLHRRRALSFRPCSSRQAPPVRGWTGCVRISRRRCRATTPPRAGSQRPVPKIAANSSRLKQIDQSLRDGQTRLAGRAAFQYRTGAPGMLDALLGASSFEELSSRMYVFSKLAKQDSALLDALKAQHAEATALHADLRSREAAQVGELKQVAAQRASVQKQVDSQQRYLDSLRTDVAALVAVQDKARSAASSSPNLAGVPKPSKTAVSKAGPIVFASVEGRSGKYAVLSGDPLSYRTTGVKFSGVTTMYGNDDNGTGTASGRRVRRERVHLRAQDAPVRYAPRRDEGEQARHRHRDRPRPVHARPHARSVETVGALSGCRRGRHGAGRDRAAAALIRPPSKRDATQSVTVDDSCRISVTTGPRIWVP